MGGGRGSLDAYCCTCSRLSKLSSNNFGFLALVAAELGEGGSVRCVVIMYVERVLFPPNFGCLILAAKMMGGGRGLRDCLILCAGCTRFPW